MHILAAKLLKNIEIANFQWKIFDFSIKKSHCSWLLKSAAKLLHQTAKTCRIEQENAKKDALFRQISKKVHLFIS